MLAQFPIVRQPRTSSLSSYSNPKASRFASEEIPCNFSVRKKRKQQQKRCKSSQLPTKPKNVKYFSQSEQLLFSSNPTTTNATTIKCHNLPSAYIPKDILLDTKDHILRDLMIESWLENYHNKKIETPFVSPVLYCYTKLFELKSMTAHMINDHPFRKAVICDLFAKLCEHPQYRILKPFQMELYQMLFSNSSGLKNYDPLQSKCYNVYDYIRFVEQKNKQDKRQTFRGSAIANIMSSDGRKNDCVSAITDMSNKTISNIIN